MFGAYEDEEGVSATLNSLREGSGTPTAENVLDVLLVGMFASDWLGLASVLKSRAGVRELSKGVFPGVNKSAVGSAGGGVGPN